MKRQGCITNYFPPLGPQKTRMSNESGQKKMSRIHRRRNLSPTEPHNSNRKQQMFLDLGQRNFGHTTCATCGMIYTNSQPEDEAYHGKFHDTVVSALRFNGWKNEHFLEHYDDGRVLVVSPNDPPSHLKKATSIHAVVDNELGFSSEASSRMKDAKTYLFVAGKKVVGCVVAVHIEEAFSLLPYPYEEREAKSSDMTAWCCSSEPTRAICGISRIWVFKQYRRKRVATRLLDCVRFHVWWRGCQGTNGFFRPNTNGKTAGRILLWN
ncbi:N-acetyltransferase ESCO1-like isoform X2 [Xenia sp. Carnegie-2017]|uniref:N-acetyltransferase ESCO1-like isoform X2 n=1 Tax=Xenia sp. Carnegie-2017 TaxID=2897299 RepID=UPI001F038D67|nr:N-acetyltransferase ESCO1-like isoform X2 [Xenia sp. Carnegie-2017]